jgi:GNAT superfamily N-acetyltransferase
MRRRLGGVLVRPARADEADAVAAVFMPSFRGLAFLPLVHADDQIRTWIRNEMFPGHEVWVAELAQSVVGFAALAGDLLGHLYVHPREQGRGVGTALLDVVKRERPDGFRLWVFQRNEGARRFYERHGCRLVELTDGARNEENEPDALYEWRPATGRGSLGPRATSAPAPLGAGGRGSSAR